jgi:Zn-dependent peptidase ImmA (M78 family)
MPNDVIISLLEDYVGNRIKIETIAEKYNISIVRVKLRSLKRKRSISELSLENYKCNNLTIITNESIILTL